MVRLTTIGIAVVSTLVHPSNSLVVPERRVTLRTGRTFGRNPHLLGGRGLHQRQSPQLVPPHMAPAAASDGKDDGGITEAELKRQLTEYLQKRRDVNADQAAEQAKGRVVGGTRGNAVLEFVSGAPVKEQVIDWVPNVFDYDELTKYGYPHLVTPIMGMVGGRRAVYDLMGMEAPPLMGPPPKKVAPKLVIDRTGAEDKARYSGLKMGQVLDDSAMAEALERANRREREGRELRPKLMEEEYVPPFAGEDQFDQQGQSVERPTVKATDSHLACFNVPE